MAKQSGSNRNSNNRRVASVVNQQTTPGGGNDNVNEANSIVSGNIRIRLAELPNTSRSLDERLYNIGNGYAVDVMIAEGSRTSPDRLWSASLAKVSNGRIEFMSDEKNITSYKTGKAIDIYAYLKNAQNWASNKAKKS